MNSAPLVSVYIPTHNRCALLKRAVKSVFAQSYGNIELLIVDDASHDDTQRFLQALTHKSIDIKIFRQETAQGACVARNIALKHARGEFVAGLDDDDEFMPHRISELIEHYDPSYAFICTGFLWDYGKYARVVNNTGMIISLTEQLDYNYATNQVLVDINRIRSINGFDENLVACQDYDTWTRLIKKFGSAKRVAGTSYVIHRDENLERISAPTNWLKGHRQFMNKHGNSMSPKNKLNQEFRRLIAKRETLGPVSFIKQLRAGLLKQKLRYFLSSNFQGLAKIRHRLMSK
jgi:glycosyltransferase involved in cell wall biosynthesis